MLLARHVEFFQTATPGDIGTLPAFLVEEVKLIRCEPSACMIQCVPRDNPNIHETLERFENRRKHVRRGVDVFKLLRILTELDVCRCNRLCDRRLPIPASVVVEEQHMLVFSVWYASWKCAAEGKRLDLAG